MCVCGVRQGWLYAVEAYHFAHFLVKGKSRFVEAAMLPPSAVVLEDPDWTRLMGTLDTQALTGDWYGVITQLRHLSS